MARIGLVLGAGGLVGEAFHRGVVRALRDVGQWDARDAEIVVGTSAGALMAAALRAPQPRRRTARPEQTAPEIAVPDPVLSPMPALGALFAAVRHPWRPRPGVVAAGLLPPGRRSTSFISENLDRRFGSTWPGRDTWVVAVRRGDGQRVVFGREGAPPATMGRAVAASCAVPGFFQPVTVGGHAYVDGGAHSLTNTDLLAGTGLDLVLVSSPLSVVPLGSRPVLGLSLRLFWHRRLVTEAAAVRRTGTPVLAFEPAGPLLATMGLHPLRAGRVDEVEEVSYRMACERLAGGLATPELRALAS